jgi:hypothetical protein
MDFVTIFFASSFFFSSIEPTHVQYLIMRACTMKVNLRACMQSCSIQPCRHRRCKHVSIFNRSFPASYPPPCTPLDLWDMIPLVPPSPRGQQQIRTYQIYFACPLLPVKGSLKRVSDENTTAHHALNTFWLEKNGGIPQATTVMHRHWS